MPASFFLERLIQCLKNEVEEEEGQDDDNCESAS